MFRKYALPVFILLLVAVAVYFMVRGKSQAAWQFIPSDASAVVTSDRIQDSTFVITEAAIDVKGFPLVRQAAESLSLLLWITRDIPIYDRTLQKKTVTYSYHQRTSAGFGVIVYIPLQNDTEIQWWATPNRPDIRVLRHNFQSTIITDINDSGSKPVCSYIIKDNYLILSQYGDLIEDVVRHANEPISKFMLQNQFEKADDSRYSLNLYLNRSVWGNLILNALSPQSTLAEFLKLFPSTQDYHLMTDTPSHVEFESLGSDAGDNYATKWLDGQVGKRFNRHQYISQQTSILFRIASGDSLAFKKNFRDWHGDHESPAWDRLSYFLGDQREELITSVGAELLLCQVEGTNSISDGKLALVEYANYDKLRPLLTKLARLSTTESNVSLDKYQGYDLYSIPIPELPAGLYGPLFKGFPRTFVSYVAPYLVLSNSSQVLRNYISDFENKITWQQSPELDSILISREGNADLAQITLVASPRKVNSAVVAGLFSAKVESIVYECLLSKSKAYPRLTLLPKKRRTSGKVLNRTFLSGEIEWKFGNDSLVAISQDPVAGATQLLLTDQDNNLVRPQSDFEKVKPITQLDGPLIGTPLKVDFLNIGRQQLILATERSLYALDEDGEGIVTPFRVSIPSDQPIRQLIRIEGGNEGSSRFVVMDAAENMYLWEKVNATPTKINRTRDFTNVQLPVVSLNQLGTRLLIVTQRNGLIFLIKDDGTVRPGFPVDMLTRIESTFAWTQNASTAQPEVVGVSAYGELLRVDVSGQILERRQLYRPEASTHFRTLFDSNALDWLLIRSSDTRVSILDKEGTELFQIGNISPNSTLQYHYFGVDNRFISINSGGYTSIFDLSGRRLGDKPIPSEVPVRLSYQASYYKIFIFGRSAGKYQAWTIKIR
ncbi:hypothetical protein [Salmonirosea aquatica]|uniref:Uncharacterized protein n=1 Tax=Salmonirosea aquatica TaxID=2654236 RepID=A0A7C9FFG3_9BACT|nr:hypothetical protein [Cytophagaceae bacterium SJW1-29]